MHTTPITRRRTQILATAVLTGAFAGLAGISAPVATANFPVGGAIADEYHAAAEANGMTPEEFFGPVLTPELHAADGGRYQDFQHSQSIYWHPDVSDGTANQIGGDIRTKWGMTFDGQVGYERGPLGYPTTREWSSQPSPITDVVARGNHFQGGSVYVVPETGSFVTWGLIREAWWRVGAEASALGHLVSDEQVIDGGWAQDFENGRIQAYPDGLVAIIVHGADEAGIATDGPVELSEVG